MQLVEENKKTETNYVLRINKNQIIEHEQHVVAIMIALKPSITGVMFSKITKDDVKFYFAKIRKQDQEEKAAEAERLKQLENLRTAALNKDLKL